MLHPVGKLPASVYWRRRIVLLVVLVALLGGGGWGGYWLVTRNASAATRSAAASRPPGTPALERVVPSFAGLLTPTPPAALPSVAPRTPAGPKPGGPCTDAMIAVAVHAPASAAVGTKPTFALVVTNTSAVPCVRALDKGLQEIVLVDARNHRLWGSNDCFPEASSDRRTLAPHQAVSLPIVWGGLTSSPGCSAARVRPAPGAYQLRGRIAGALSPMTPFRLT